VPEVLRSGDHGRIERWRRAQALVRTLRRRPDLVAERGGLSEDEITLLLDHDLIDHDEVQLLRDHGYH
jgi:tRNA (guanine37-N1)-methyltransferase